MTMAAIGIGAGIGAAMSMGVAVIQKKPFDEVLLAGAQGAVIGGATAGFGSLLSSAPAALPNAVEPIITNAASTAVPLTSAATEAASTLATPVLSEVAGQSASTVANLAPTFGQSALEGIGKSAAPSLLAEAPSSVAPSLASTLNMPSQPPVQLMDSLNAPVGFDKLGQGIEAPLSQQELVNTDIYTTPEAGIYTTPEATIKEIMGLKPVNAQGVDPKAWTNADYTAAINAGSSAINTGANLAQSPPRGPANYSQNVYAPQRSSEDNLMNSLLNLARS